jgi:hypothetical protein
MKKIHILTASILLSTGAHAVTTEQLGTAARESQNLTVQEQQRLEA